jgi:phosphohistidine phosphatase
MSKPSRTAPLTLHLLRHAKSSWDDPALPDANRPLSARGERTAAKMARQLARERVAPGLVLCSSARRTRQTLELILPALGDPEVLVEDGLYAAGAQALLSRLRQIPAGIREAMLIGHNPGIHELALVLAGRGAPASLRESFPTGALVSLTLEAAAWGDVQRGGVVTRLLLPREL